MQLVDSLRRLWRARSLYTLLLTCVLLGACAVGPDFQIPASPDIATFTADRIPSENTAGNKTQRLAAGAQIPAEYWTLFHSTPLNRLIERALRDNPNIEAARA